MRLSLATTVTMVVTQQPIQCSAIKVRSMLTTSGTPLHPQMHATMRPRCISRNSLYSLYRCWRLPPNKSGVHCYARTLTATPRYVTAYPAFVSRLFFCDQLFCVSTLPAQPTHCSHCHSCKLNCLRSVHVQLYPSININRPEPECKTYVFGKTLVCSVATQAYFSCAGVSLQSYSNKPRPTICGAAAGACWHMERAGGSR